VGAGLAGQRVAVGVGLRDVVAIRILHGVLLVLGREDARAAGRASPGSATGIPGPVG
jgi:hypothetical protein